MTKQPTEMAARAARLRLGAPEIARLAGLHKDTVRAFLGGRRVLTSTADGVRAVIEAEERKLFSSLKKEDGYVATPGY